MKRNLTLRLDSGAIRKAKLLAAQRGTSVSELLQRFVDERLRADDAYEGARRQALELLDRGFRLGGRIGATRDELHER
ncbi:MAG: hypothetical protein HY705_09875 [Gemmatimonadetes bacterium]|nr:hypothetical protein [Gemmatimonadota bacterium]